MSNRTQQQINEQIEALQSEIASSNDIEHIVIHSIIHNCDFRVN
jgi:hypothetical protein